MSKSEKFKDGVFGKDDEMVCDDVMVRDDKLCTPTGLPKKGKFAFIQVDDFYSGAIMRKSDIKNLMKWCQKQLDNWDKEEE